jgi:hypothetical protein
MKRLFFWVTVSEVSVQGLDVGDTEHHGGVCVVRESPSPRSVWDAERRRRERERQREREKEKGGQDAVPKDPPPPSAHFPTTSQWAMKL